MYLFVRGVRKVDSQVFYVLKKGGMTCLTEKKITPRHLIMRGGPILAAAQITVDV
jgi:hypothetical protein